MSKILFWLGIFLVLLLVSRLLARHKVRQRQQSAVASRRRPAAPSRPQTMVRCAHCGVHLPAEEAVRQHGHAFCGANHARLGAR